MHDVFQGARATVWEIQPDPLKNNEDIIDKDNGGKKAYDLFKSREIQENSVAGIDVSDGNIPGERVSAKSGHKNIYHRRSKTTSGFY